MNKKASSSVNAEKHGKPHTPSMTWFEVLLWLSKKHPVSEFSSLDVASHFDVSVTAASMLLGRMHWWKFIEHADTVAHGKKMYKIDELGREKIEELKKGKRR